MKVITIGRSTENNDIVVNDEKVSRNHLQMVMDDNGNYSVVDLCSTNGTYVNGQRISGEVRLRLGDEVRIGQTVLPWQNYFVTSSQQPIVNPPMPPQPPKSNPNRTWIYIVIGAALLLLIGGGVAWKIYHDKQKEKIEQEERDKEQQERQLEQEANDARVKAARLSEEAEAAARRAAETQSGEDRRAADVAARRAEEAILQAREKQEELENIRAQAEAAAAALDAAQVAIESAESQRQEAEARASAADNERQRAQETAEEAERARKEAEKRAKLTTEFYRLIPQVKPSLWSWETDPFQVIIDESNLDESNLTVMEGEENKEFIIRSFENVDNVQKQKIVDAIKKVLGQQLEEEVRMESDTTNKGVEVEQPVPETNDTITY